ncbi:dihydropteroate synthase [Fodinicurvata sp. EGI_FJ10296]|uniref:dihydropteroate synthase n=1 Tax=Fodinicurvata sp. EGI_FJ10296 TaxID=3231908 RepID=UPI0034550329
MMATNGSAGDPALHAQADKSPGLDRGFCRWLADDPSARLYLRPLPLAISPGGFCESDLGGVPKASGLPGALPLAGGPVQFAQIEVIVRPASGDGLANPGRAVANADDVRDWARTVGREDEVARRLANLTAPRAALAGLSLDRPRVMGIVNVTPDSFSDGGDFSDRQLAIDHGRSLVDAGCDILDIGGESTRPGAMPVPVARELERVLPVIEALAPLGVPISIDTRHADVMRAALAVGARIINDVTALTGDRESPPTAAAADPVPVVLMHMLGEPQTMQDAPRYDCAPLDVADRLEAFCSSAMAAGIDRSRLVIDPGIGFGKTVAHNIDVLRHTAMLHMYGFPVLIGLSRKRFLGSIGGTAGGPGPGSNSLPPKARLPASLAAGMFALQQGAQILRVHDGAETVQAVRLLQALR